MSFPILSRHAFMTGSLSALTLLTAGEGVSAEKAYVGATSASPNPLPSWAPGITKRAIMTFVSVVSQPGHDFVPPEARIAVFDTNGALWAEQPAYFDLVFAIERAGQMVKESPALRDRPAFAAMADCNMVAFASLSETDLMAVALAMRKGLKPEEYHSIIRNWLVQARHPRSKVAYPSRIYQPQLELLAYLRANGFRTYIVSGRELPYMRPFAQEVYGMSPEQAIGTSQKTEYELRAGRGVVMARPGMNSVDDGLNNIALSGGARPLVAVGNSDVDQQRLEYASTAERPGLQILIHHDDAEREYAYDCQFRIGKLDTVLDELGVRGRVVVSMKNDWKTVFAPSD